MLSAGLPQTGRRPLPKFENERLRYPYEAEIQAWIDRTAKPEGQGWTKQDYEMHIREEHSTFAWIIEGMFKQAGFHIAEVNYITPVLAEYLCETASGSRVQVMMLA